MKKLYLAIALLLGLQVSAFAQTPDQVVAPCVTYPPTDRNPLGGCQPVSSTVPLPVTGAFTPGGTQDINVKNWDGSALGAPSNYGTSPGAVTVPGVNAFVTNTLNSGGFDSGVISATATPANSSHAAGTSIGGLFLVAIARTAGGSGIITNLNWKSTGASTGQLVLRIWQKNPVNTTCTDNVAFVGSDTDDAFLITSPFSITPAAPASTTGDANTYASVAGVTWDYKNVDTSPGQNVYVCPVTVSTDTADENKLVRVQLSGPQN